MLNHEPVLRLVKDIALKLQENEFQNNKQIEHQITCLFFNRIIQDIEASLVLSGLGYFGSARSLIAIVHRNMRMFASLITADNSRLDAFWNEEADTYQDKESNFSKNFGENPSRKLAQKEFGEDSFLDFEFEKSLHGSCFALRKYYTDRVIESGLRIPVVTFGPFQNEKFSNEVESLATAFLIDFLGIFFTKYQDRDYLKNELALYYKLTKSIIASDRQDKNEP